MFLSYIELEVDGLAWTPVRTYRPPGLQLLSTVRFVSHPALPYAALSSQHDMCPERGTFFGKPERSVGRSLTNWAFLHALHLLHVYIEV